MRRGSRSDDVERLLRGAPTPAPPVDLGARIKSEIPPALPRAARAATRRFPAGVGWSFSRLSLVGSLAAHGAVLVVAVALGWWLRANWVPAPPVELGALTAPEETAGARQGDGVLRDTDGFLAAATSHVARVALTSDTGSLDAVRRYLDAGYLPPPSAVHPAQIVGAFDYGDAPPPGAVALRAEGGPSPFSGNSQRRLLRFNMRSRVVDPLDRRPASIVFLIDVSGAMKDERRLEALKGALSDLFGALRPTDRVALVAFGAASRVVLDPTADRSALANALASLTPEDASATAEALEQGLALGLRSFADGRCSKVVVCSGGFSGRDLAWASPVLSRIAAQARGGLEFSAIGLGLGAVGDDFLERFARVTRGTYSYADTRSEARRAFLEQLTGAPQTVAADAEAQIDFNPRVVSRYRLVGDDRGATTASFAAPGRGQPVDVDAGESVTSLYEVELQSGAPDDAVATFSLRYRPAGRLAFLNETRELRASDVAAHWETASAALRLAAAAAEFAESLRAQPGRRETGLEAAFHRARTVVQGFPGRADIAAFAALAGAAVHAKPYSAEAAALAGAGPEAFSVVVGEATEPVVVQRVEPMYPEVARRTRVEGTVLLRVHVGPSGAVEQVEVTHSIPLLDPAAVAAVRRWKYRPSLVDGHPVPGFATVAVRFQLAP